MMSRYVFDRGRREEYYLWIETVTTRICGYTNFVTVQFVNG